MKWRLILQKVTTLEEFNTYYDIYDMYDANIALNVKDQAEEKAIKEAEKA
jgi:hypothetical protein